MEDCYMKSEHMDFENIVLTEEDVDPFALGPKVEVDDDAEIELELEYHSENAHSVPSCLICNRDSKRWPKKHLNQVQALAESLCKLFAIPNIPYENDFAQAKYCVQCQSKFLKIRKVLQQLESLQQFIIEARVDVENQLCESTNATTLEILEDLSEEQKEINSIRRKIATKLGLVTTETDTELQTGPLEDEEQSLRIESVDTISPIEDIVPHVPENGSDSEWDPGDTEVRMSSDSDYEPEPKYGRQTRSSAKRRATGQSSNRKQDSEPESANQPIMIVKLERLQTDSDLPRKKTKRSTKSKQKKSSNIDRTTISTFLATTFNEDSNEETDPDPSYQYTGTRDYNVFHCDLCKSRFISQYKLNVHIKSKHEGVEKPFTCDFPGCSKTFKRKYLVKSHKRSHSTEKPFVCDYCGRDFKTEVLLLLHQQNKHVEGGRKFKCDKCDKAFVTQHRLTVHNMSHTKMFPFICECCGQGFAHKSTLNEHITVKHSEDNPFKCEYENCGKTFLSKHSVNLHGSVHTGIYPYKCEVCGQGVHSTNRLKKHMLKHSERLFACELCGSKFTYTSSLKKHMMSHNGVKPYKCDICGNSFIDLSKLKRHMKVHTGDRQFQCQVCHKCFYTQDYLTTHMEYHTAAIAQGKGTINAAKIRRIHQPGTTGARSATRGKSAKSDQVFETDSTSEDIGFGQPSTVS